ncbi:4-hydroxy-3-methylbut-2-enyl diphosphate reductase [bacterium]|nr:4-hydroxy-3-methylbut-2-enyl diphosphate reductase [bacterium]
MKITVADNSGVCFGVRRAFSLLEEAVENAKKSGIKVFMLGPLIHNPRVIAQYAEKSVKVIDTGSITENSCVVIRSHGITKEERAQLDRFSGITLVDTTCPYVQRIHQLVEKRSSEGFAVLIMGDREHSEVRGITSKISGDFFVIHPSEFDSKSKELASFTADHAKIFAVAQTTSRPANYEYLLKKVRKTVAAMPGHRFLAAETICTATLKRQDSAGELAKKTDSMVVVGGKNSSNTSKLFQVVSEKNSNSFWVESPEDFTASDIETLKRSGSVGITAGASTPDEQIAEMRSFLESLNG